MRKIFIVISLMILLSATAAQAAFTSTVVGYEYSTVGATITVDMVGSELTMRVENTSTVPAYLTSLAFQVPTGMELDFTGAYDLSGDPLVYVQNKNKTYEWTYGSLSASDFSSSEKVRNFKDDVNAGLFTDQGFMGGKVGLGIGSGEIAIFTFDAVGPFGEFDPFLVRFQEVDGGGSDIATPTPVPGAVWLFGSGLIGLVGLRRFRG